jgi:enterochelin esterase family protein
MRFRILFLGALLLAALGAVVSPGKVKAGEIKKGLTFASRALKSDMTFSLYLPDAYRAEPERKFPVVYLLHGYGGNDREWIELGGVDAVLDRMIASGEIPPVIAVMPYAARSWYVDSGAMGGPGNYESAIAADLIEHVDASYRTVAERTSRAVAGLSMGGYGAVRMAFFHPDSFVGVVTLSGALHQTDNIALSEQPLLLANLNQRAERKYHGAYGTPFDMNLFVARNPFTRIADLSRMPSPPKVLIMTGDDDGLNFYEGSCQLFVALRRANLHAELRVENGGHDWRLWSRQLPDLLRFLTDAMRNPQQRTVDEGGVMASAPVRPIPAAAPQPAATVASSPAPMPAVASQPASGQQHSAKRAETRPAQQPVDKPLPIAAETISLKPVAVPAGPPAAIQAPAAKAATIAR